MKKLSFLVCFAVFILACSDRDKVPKGILPKQKMQEVIWDILRAGELLEGYVFKDTTPNKTNMALQWYDSIYALHHISKADFDRSYDYYRTHPELMKVILDSLSKKTVPPEIVDSAQVKPDSAKPAGPDSIQKQSPDSVRPALPKKDSLSRKRSLPGRKDKLLFIDSVKRKRRLLHAAKP